MKKLTIVALVVAFLLPAPPAEAWSSSQRCPVYEQTLVKYQPVGGWDVRKMSYVMWRESRCQPEAISTTHDHGLLQVNRINFRYLAAKFRVPLSKMATWLKVPVNNVRAAAALCTYARRAWGNCYRPWRL